MQQSSLLGLILDRSLGNLVRMFKMIRLPKAERGRLSWNFVATLAVVMAYGLVMLFSASYPSGYNRYSGDLYHFIRPQTIYAIIGFALAVLVVSNINYRALRLMNETLYILTLILLVLVLFSPASANKETNCHRWLLLFWNRGPSFQPSELAKFSVILWIADYTDRHYAQRKTLQHGIIMPVLPVVPVLVLLWIEPHHSAFLLVIMIFGTMLVCGGCGGGWLPVAGAAGLAGLYFLLINSEGTVETRLGGVWGLNPSDTSNMDWQTKQSLYSISSGGLFGLGIGNSRQKQLWLPYAENDFIFSIVCEELGFVGAVLLILLFAALIIQGIFIALRAPDYYGSMLAIGIVAQVAWQVFCHIGVVTALLPNTGVSLPFFSSGGSSLLLLLLEMGVLMSISRAGNARADAMQQRRQSQLAQRMGERRTYRRETQP